MFGHRPVGYMQEVDWVGNDVWFAHAVWVNDEEIGVFAQHNCGVAHCPSSNMRLASGIAPIKEYRNADVNVGLGVDGSASNDGSSLLAEVRQAFLLSRVKEGITGYSLSNDPNRKLMTAREALYLGTRGGAAVLGRSDIGSLEVGKCADFFAVDLNRIEYSGGAVHDPVSAVVFCQPVRVDYTVAGGEFVVREGSVVTLDEGKLVETHNEAAKRLLSGY
jgi:cytosine/adenosine deaminase-related metal-dependent hydrolase